MEFQNEISECGIDQTRSRQACALASEAYENLADLKRHARTERQTGETVAGAFDSLIFTNPYSDLAVESAGRRASKQVMDAGVDRPAPAASIVPARDSMESTLQADDATLCGDPQIERAGLRELAEAHLSPERLSRFQENMAAFERSAAAQGLQPREVAATMHAVSRLFETRGGAPVSAVERIRLAEQVMRQAAVPTDVNQGSHSTCSVASLESMVYTWHPSRAAELVAAIATTGEFHLQYPEGEQVTNPEPIVRLQPASLIPDHEARLEPLPDGKRSYASQIFQVTAANVHYAMANATGGSQIWYVQEEPDPGRTPRDTGERVMDFAEQPPRRLADRNGRDLDAPELSDSSVVEVANHILGDRNTVFLRHADRNSPKDPDDGHQLISASTPEQMTQRLTELRSQGRLPAIVMVHADHPPFAPEGKPGGGSMAWHILTVTNFDKTTNMVSLDNQWGRDDDLTGSRALHVSDLVRVGSDPDVTPPNFAAMDRQREANRDAGHSDHGLELEYLQLQRQYHRIDQAQYEEDAAFALANFLHQRGITTTDGWEQALNRDDRRRVSRVLFQLHEGPGETRDQRGTVILRLANEELLRMPESIECRNPG